VGDGRKGSSVPQSGEATGGSSKEEERARLQAKEIRIVSTVGWVEEKKHAREERRRRHGGFSSGLVAPPAGTGGRVFHCVTDTGKFSGMERMGLNGQGEKGVKKTTKKNNIQLDVRRGFDVRAKSALVGGGGSKLEGC